MLASRSGWLKGREVAPSDDDEAATGGRRQTLRITAAPIIAFALALCAPLACHFALVSPAAAVSAEAWQALEEAERDEVASALAYGRSRSAAAAMESQVAALTGELVRMRDAEASVRAQFLALGKVPHRAGGRSASRAIGVGDWMPHGLPKSAHGGS